MSYFEPVPNKVGMNKPADNPCKLLDFGYLSLNDGESFEGKTGDREVRAVWDEQNARWWFSVFDVVASACPV